MPTLKTSDALHISDLTFDQAFGGELVPAEQQALDRHLEQCVRCSLRRDVLLAQREAFLARVPTWDALAASAEPKVQRQRGSVAWLAGSALAAAAALLIVLLPKSELAGVRSKGRPYIGAFIKRGEQVTPVHSGDFVRAGDLLRVTYTSQTQIEFGLLHRDARRASIYYPLATRTSPVHAGRAVALDFSVRLDDVPGSEQLYGLFCYESTELEALRAALEATGHLPSIPHCRIDTMTLTKQTGP